jgi:hypothetical protein
VGTKPTQKVYHCFWGFAMRELEQWLKDDPRHVIAFFVGANNPQTFYCVLDSGSPTEKTVDGFGNGIVPSLLDAIEKKFHVTLAF